MAPVGGYLEDDFFLLEEGCMFFCLVPKETKGKHIHVRFGLSMVHLVGTLDNKLELPHKIQGE